MDPYPDSELASLDPVAAFGPAKHPDRPVARARPEGLDDPTVAALAKVGEALEAVEHARGLLYAFHRHCGIADLTLQEAVEQLRAAGRAQIAEELEEVLVGRDIVPGRWSFQLVEGYDEHYWAVFRAMERRARLLAGGMPAHLFHAEMQYDEQTPDEDGPPGSRG